MRNHTRTALAWMDCYSSYAPAALRASLLYDNNNDDGTLWTRTSQDAPLPLCSSSHPPDSSCLVCSNQTVFVMCRNLTKGVKVMMEAGTDQVPLSKSECPELFSDDAPQSQLAVIISSILIPFILILLIIIGGVFCRKRSRKRRRIPPVQAAPHPHHGPFSVVTFTICRGTADGK
ncbi:uncharacterized protein LOC144523000 isoform X2 [Sander vitreus]